MATFRLDLITCRKTKSIETSKFPPKKMTQLYFSALNFPAPASQPLAREGKGPCGKGNAILEHAASKQIRNRFTITRARNTTKSTRALDFPHILTCLHAASKQIRNHFTIAWARSAIKSARAPELPASCVSVCGMHILVHTKHNPPPRRRLPSRPNHINHNAAGLLLLLLLLSVCGDRS